MKKKRNKTSKTMPHEEARQAVRDCRYDVAGAVQLDPNEVMRTLQDYEGMPYLVFSDFISLAWNAAHRLVDKMDPLGSAYTNSVPLEVARAFLIAILRIPANQRRIDQDPDDRRQTEAEMMKLGNAIRDAAKISRDVKASTELTESPPTIEAVNKMIMASNDPAGVRSQLESARAGDPPITLNNNELLPQVEPMPKALLSECRHTVELKVDCVHNSICSAEVTIVRALDESVPPALEGLIDVLVPARFTDRKGKFRRMLLGTQWANGSIEAVVEVMRGFRASDVKYNSLTICKLKPTHALASAMEREAVQLKLDLAPDNAVPHSQDLYG